MIAYDKNMAEEQGAWLFSWTQTFSGQSVVVLVSVTAGADGKWWGEKQGVVLYALGSEVKG